jgi:hypothetical protein
MRGADDQVGFPVIEWLRWQVALGVAALPVPVVTDLVAVGSQAGEEVRYALGLLPWQRLEQRSPRADMVWRSDKCFQPGQAFAKRVVVLPVPIVGLRPLSDLHREPP